MSDTLRAALIFLTQTVFDLYLFILIIRLVLAFVGASYTHPVTQFITRLTSFIIKPMRKFIPNIREFETATFVLILLVEITKYLFISAFSYGMPNIFGLILIGIADSVQLLLQTFTYAIIIQAIMTWIQPGSPMNSLLDQFTSPIMRPLQRIIPPVGGMDITPIPAIIILQLLSIVLVKPLIAVGLSVAFG